MNFSEIYMSYYPRLLRFAKEFVILEEDAENIIQDVFLGLWERHESLIHVENMNAYFFRLVRNRCLDHLRHKISEEKYHETVQSTFEMELNLKLQSLDRFDESFFSEESIENLVREAIDSLPERCREIFLLSRTEGLRYREISERLGLSVNTIESQMSIALKKLKSKLKYSLSA